MLLCGGVSGLASPSIIMNLKYENEYQLYLLMNKQVIVHHENPTQRISEHNI